MTTTLGTVSGSVQMVFGGLSLSWSGEGVLFLCEQDRMMSATPMRPKIRANPPKRYGNGEFHRHISLEELLLFAGLISFSVGFSFLQVRRNEEGECSIYRGKVWIVESIRTFYINEEPLVPKEDSLLCFIGPICLWGK